MVSNPPEGTQRIVPYLYYADAPGAIDFLCRAFGFVERFRLPMPDGGVGHAELALHDNVLMLASVCPDRNMSAPNDLPATHGLVMCYVDDVDAHHARAVAAGAEIVQPLETKFYGDRTYGAKDPDGHTWYFSTHVEDIAPEDMHPPEG